MAVGILRAGLPGALAAWLGFTLPSAVALILALLGAFKAARGAEAGLLQTVIIPLGLSYYALKAIHYSIESLREPPAPGFLAYLDYLLFLPTLIAGPINRFQEFQRSSRRRRWDPALF